ncbi:MAG: MBL fold metallo-hydrolase [Deltaproteobacteria bacterium]|nr:MAG: MBL fold metallo-hydrolase [Deltaproteobacteria bacterium]
MKRNISVTVLVENTARDRGTIGEHGLAFWIETGSARILFDTGQGMALPNNAKRLDIPLDRTDAVVLSHGHYDHTGGLLQVLAGAPGATVHAHPGVFDPKFARNPDGTSRAIGMPEPDEAGVRKRARDLVLNRGPVEVADGIFITGEIPRVTSFEDTGGPFFLDPGCTRPDPVLDDQALFFDTPAGLVVILGCAHAGVINTLRHIRGLAGDRPVHAVMGGMHLVAASRRRMDRTLEELQGIDPDRLGPAHCTGMAACVALWTAFPGRCFACRVGTRIETA